MFTIGLRASPKEVVFAVYDAGSNAVVNIESLKIPAAFSIPIALKYVRSNMLDILKEYNIKKAGIRITESSSKNLDISRIQIEGVLQEAFASSGVETYYTGQVSSISKLIDIERIKFLPIIAGANELDIDGWEQMDPKGREALLCAMGAKNV